MRDINSYKVQKLEVETMKKTIYVFLGLPASGKGTQAKTLADKMNISLVSAGDLIRKIIKSSESDPFISEIKKRYDAGIPQPDEVVVDLFKKFLDEASGSVILDNFPFSKGQAEFLTNYIGENDEHWDKPKIIFIKLDPEVAVRRAITRKICTECGSIYGAISEMICEKCGGSLIVRSDDNEDTMRTRIKQYIPRLNELVEYYKNGNGDLIEIDGDKSVSEITSLIEKRI